MKKRNIYPNRSQELLQLFETATNGANIMCVPIDYAKEDHMVMFYNGYGDILRKPFSVKNSPAGVTYLLEQVNRSCRHRGIKNEHESFTGYRQFFELPENKRPKKIRLRITDCFSTNSRDSLVTVMLNP